MAIFESAQAFRMAGLFYGGHPRLASERSLGIAAANGRLQASLDAAEQYEKQRKRTPFNEQPRNFGYRQETPNNWQRPSTEQGKTSTIADAVTKKLMETTRRTQELLDRMAARTARPRYASQPWAFGAR